MRTTSRVVITRIALLLLAALIALAVASKSTAQQAAANSGESKADKEEPAKGEANSADRSLDDQLFDDLTDDLMKELPERDDPAQENRGKRPTPLDPTDEELQRTLETGDEGGGSEDDELARLARKMQDAEQLLSQLSAGNQTQQLQQSILSDLDKLINELKKKKKKNSNSSGKNSSQSSKQSGDPQRTPGKSSGSSGGGSGQTPGQPGPSRESSGELRKDKIEQADADEMRARMKDLWGHLPERVREAMLQSSTDQFLPKYQLLIEDYFRRLVEEQSP